MSAIRVELQLADGSFTTGMLRAGQTVEQFNKQLMRTHPQLEKMAANGETIYKSMARAEQGTGSFLGTLRDVAIVVGAVSIGFNAFNRTIGNVLGKVVSVNAEMERLQMLMANMSTAKDPMADATESIDTLIDMASKAPFSLQALTNGFVKLKATGTDPLTGSMQSLADAIAAAGGNDESFNRIVLGISQMRGKGVIQMEEMRQQLSESMPRAMELMARSMGVSMADLVDAIATGRVEASHALDQFYEELELTFGGTALKMMDTWDGKMAQLSTNLIKLSRTAGEGFFEKIKDELQNLNDFLATPAASEWARSLGEGVGSIVGIVRDVMEVLVDMQEPIKIAGLLLAGTLGGTAIINGLGNVARGLANISVGAVAMSANLRASSQAKAAATAAAQRNTAALNAENVALATQATRLKTLGPLLNGSALGRMGSALGGLAGALGRFAGIASGVLGWAGLLGAGIVLLADHFGWFTNKADEAAAALDNFDSANAEEFSAISEEYSKHITTIEAQITAQKNALQNARDMLAANDTAPGPQKFWFDLFDGINEMTSGDSLAKRIAEGEDALADLEKTHQEMLARREAAEKRHANAVMRERMSAHENQINEELRLDRSKNDEARKRISSEYTLALAAAEGNEKEVVRLREKYAQDMHNNQLEFLGRQIDVYTAHFDEVAKLMEAAGEDEKGIYSSIYDNLNTQIADFTERRARLIENGPASIKLIDSPNVSDKAFEDASNALVKLQDSMNAMGAGGDDTVRVIMALNKAIKDQDFGTVKDGATEFRKLRDQIAKTWAEQKKLDEVMEGRKSFNDRLRALLDENALNLWRAEQEAKGLPTDEIAELDWRLERGEFAGLGPQLDEQTRNAILQLDRLEAEAEAVAAAAQQQAFGDTTQQTINTTASNVRLLKEEVMLLSGALNGISFDSMMTLANGGLGGGIDSFGGYSNLAPTRSNASKRDRMAQAMNYFMSQGWTREQAAGIVGNLSGESSMNPSARNPRDGRDGSDSIGIAQWNSTRAIGLKNFAARKGTSWEDYQTQLEYIQHELMTNEAAAGNRLRLAGTPEQASNTFMRAFERPSNESMITSGPKRAAAALEAMGLVGGTGSTPVSVTLDQGSVSAIGDSFVAPVASLNQTLEARTYDEAKAGIADARAGANLVDERTQANALAAAVSQLQKAIDNANKGVAHDGMTVEQVQRQIQDGKYGETDLGAEHYREVLRLAKEYEDAVQRIKDAEDARADATKSLEDLAKQEVELTGKAADLHEQLRTGVESSTGKLRDFIAEIDAHVEAVRVGYGADSTEYANALEHRKQLLSNFHMTENLQAQMASQKRTQSIQQSLMSESQARQFAMQQRLAELDAMIAAVDQSEAQGVELVRQYEAEKAAIRAQYAQQMNPMARQMQEWGDLQGNLARQSTQWMNSLADGLTNLIMGTGDLRSVLQGIMKDMLNSVIKYMMSGMGGKGGGAGAKGGMGKAAMGGGAKAGGGMGKLFGMAHTGGIVGQSRLAGKVVNPSVFAGAKKYHTGGIIGPAGKLAPGEVPIIAKKGEGVFTPEQMQHLGGTSIASNVQINAPVTVHANGGTPEQNDDLAKKISRQLQGELRGLVVQEMMTAMRPGNIANSRTR